MIDDKSVDTQLTEIAELLKRARIISNDVRCRAELCEITEIQFKELADLAREGIKIAVPLYTGDTITAEWINARDNLFARLRCLVLDAPNAREEQNISD